MDGAQWCASIGVTGMVSLRIDAQATQRVSAVCTSMCTGVAAGASSRQTAGAQDAGRRANGGSSCGPMVRERRLIV